MVDVLYNFNEPFERSVCLLLASSPSFYGKLGKCLEPERFPSAHGKLVAKAAKAVYETTGRGPSSRQICMQSARTLAFEGKIAERTVQLADEWLASADVIDETQAIQILLPTVKRDMSKRVALEAAQAYGSGEDMDKVLSMIQTTKSLGRVDTGGATLLEDDSIEEYSDLKLASVLPTGIAELDASCNGGFGVGTLTIYVADYGVGKSMMLCHQTAYAALKGASCLYVTFELSQQEIRARVKAGILGMRIDDIKMSRAGMQQANALLKNLKGKIGPVSIVRMSRGATPYDVIDLRKREEAKQKRKFDFVALDYMDLMSSPNARENENSYKALGTVADMMREDAELNGYWLATASQPKRMQTADKSKPRRLGGSDMADSINKARIADHVVGISKTEDSSAYIYYIDKHRTVDCAGTELGPIPHARAKGRMAEFVNDDHMEASSEVEEVL